jgi:eukaryotic translation initiation factor 2C
VVNVGTNTNPSYLPVEVGHVLSGQNIKRKLNPDQTQNMIKFACRKPFESGLSIVSGGREILGLNPATNSIAVSLLNGPS